ncbi:MULTISPECIES: type II secretion system protein M [Ferrimonas]|uniref:type II secretion system protein M n=1 Tax=Ferrimonas TaxID=44011 RepID=UPI000406C2EB|nr:MULTISPECIES: type II secretion system protein M [Ferrimonas]USD37809.1 type II secretion system protein M [Ferrimonas sp. SCSIO 43195]
MMAAVKLWWSKLNPRERQMLTLAAPFLVVGLFYWMVWQPLGSAVTQAERGLKSEQAKLASLKADASRYLNQKSGSGTQARGSLSQLATESARQFALSIDRMQPQGDKLQVWLDESSFDGLLNWLSFLSEQGVRVEALDLSRADTNGKVEVRRLQLVKG